MPRPCRHVSDLVSQSEPHFLSDSTTFDLIIDQTVEIGFSLSKISSCGTQIGVWQSNDYAKVRVNSARRIDKVLDPKPD